MNIITMSNSQIVITLFLFLNRNFGHSLNCNLGSHLINAEADPLRTVARVCDGLNHDLTLEWRFAIVIAAADNLLDQIWSPVSCLDYREHRQRSHIGIMLFRLLCRTACFVRFGTTWRSRELHLWWVAQ